MPHKFKIAVGGCPNNCVKPNLNDLGIVGQRVPMIDYAKCRGCRVCQVETSCPIHIAKVEDGKIKIDPNACNNCGRCKDKCPFGALEYMDGYKVYIGGRWGKQVANGQPLNKIFTSEEESWTWWNAPSSSSGTKGSPGNAWRIPFQRLGFSYVEDKLLHAPIDKSAI